MNLDLAKPISILVLGATGLIGSTIFKRLSRNSDFDVYGTVRNSFDKSFFSDSQALKLFDGFEFSKYHKWNKLFQLMRPNVVINCLGITKHREYGNDPLKVIPTNSYFPHYLNSLCQDSGARLVHISSDCVFSGGKGEYLESDTPDAGDLYGRSKALGELYQGPAITIRTSTIGHELHTEYGLLNWFLMQNGSCHGFTKAFFSGLTTNELAKIIEQHVIPNRNLQGLYHLGASRIAKFDLLNLIAREYDKKILIVRDESFVIDRSLNSDKFCEETGYLPHSWERLIQEMHEDLE